MRWIIASVVLVIAILVGINAGWRFVFAPVLAWALLKWLLASLRVLYTDTKYAGGESLAMSPNERTVFWCEECGTEVQLVVRGTQRAPSHCGQRMNERTELLGDV